MITSCAVAGLIPADQLERRLDRLITSAETAYKGILDEIEKIKAEDFLRRAREAAEQAWRHVASGSAGPAPAVPRVALDGSDDDDGIADTQRRRNGRINASNLQRELSILTDATKQRRLEVTLRQQGAWKQLDRINDLRSADVSHKWLYHLDAQEGSVLMPIDFTANVQKRLGCRSYTGPAPCRLCGGHVDAHLEHSETCSTSEATRGHYACVRAIVNGIKLVDPAVTTEPRGFTSTTLRPADIFTNAAVPGRGAALDVCVASPNAAAAMGDAAESAFQRKLRRYRQEIQKLAAAGVAFRPLVWTADGRPHPAATRTLRYAAEIAVTRNGQQASAGALVSRWQHEIQIAILRRRGAMARAVLPKASAQELWLLTGQPDMEGSNEHRVPPLEDDGTQSEIGSAEKGENDMDDDEREARGR